MPVPIGIIVSAFEIAQNEKVLRAAKGLWAKTKWGRDATKSALVEERVGTLLTDVRGLARNLAGGEVGPAIERRVGGFERELKELGVGDEVAREMTVGVRRQIEDGIVGPMRELKLLEDRLNELEQTALSAEASVTGLRTEIARMKLLVYGAGGLAALSLFALLVSLLARR